MKNQIVELSAYIKEAKNGRAPNLSPLRVES